MIKVDGKDELFSVFKGEGVGADVLVIYPNLIAVISLCVDDLLSADLL